MILFDFDFQLKCQNRYIEKNRPLDGLDDGSQLKPLPYQIKIH